MKGQIFSLDLIYAIIILLLIVGTLSIVSLQYVQYEREASINRDLEIKSQYASNTLLYSPGVPSDWEERITG